MFELQGFGDHPLETIEVVDMDKNNVINQKAPRRKIIREPLRFLQDPKHLGSNNQTKRTSNSPGNTFKDTSIEGGNRSPENTARSFLRK